MWAAGHVPRQLEQQRGRFTLPKVKAENQPLAQGTRVSSCEGTS